MEVKRMKSSKYILLVCALSFLCFFSYDIVLTHAISYSICSSEPKQKTYIKKTVEYPGIVYWEDNVYPGFNESDRMSMIRNYLDGVHIKEIALNGSDGSVYWYSSSQNDWLESAEIRNRTRPGNLYKTIDEEVKRIAARGKKYTKDEMSAVDYRVVFDPVGLGPIGSRFLWSDEIKVIEERSGEMIAFNRRLMRKWYRMLPDVGPGNRYYAPKPMCGDSRYAGFDTMVFVSFKSTPHHPAHMGINEDLLRILGEEK